MKHLALLSILTCTVSALTSIDKIIAFADSFTDCGNDYIKGGYRFPSSPPYWQGRFSNGPTWLEWVDQHLTNTKVINNGHGGATTNSVDAYSLYGEYLVPGLKQQIESIYVNGTSNDLYIIYIGYNDLNSIVNPGEYTVVNKNYSKEKVAQNVVEGVRTLVALYEAKEFLIMNVPPFNRWPIVKDADKDFAKQLIEDYNRLLETQLKQNVQGVNFNFIDDHTWFEQQIANPGALNLSTSNGPCTWGIGNREACKDASSHFFFDSYHPEAKVHAALGQWVIQKLESFYSFNLD